ncbi:MAG: hypothetical protein AB1665_07380 [Candidatus Thermoplasmatota archaeon]
MAQRAHMKEGHVVCSSCSAVVEPSAERCPQCGEVFDSDIEGMACPYCGTILRRFSTECINCGLRFKAVKPKPKLRTPEDEEFLKRLLDWGKRMMEEEETEEEITASEQAMEVFREVVGVEAPTPVQEEQLKEIEESVKEWKELEKREESILRIAEPLEAALRARHTSLAKAEEELMKLRAELDSLSADKDPAAIEKRTMVEQQMSTISREKAEIERIEKSLVELDDTYKALLARHKREIEAKEQELQKRLDAFRSELGKRERERLRLERKEAVLREREKELAARIVRIEERERELDAKEDDLKRRIEELKRERAMLAAGDVGAYAAAEGEKWVLDPSDVREAMMRSKKSREEWLAAQREVQQETLRLHQDARKDDAKVKSLGARIAELESQLGKMEAEKAALMKEARSLQAVDDEVRKVLKLLDDLLEHLPDEVIERFAKSKEFELYEKVMSKYKV